MKGTGSSAPLKCTLLVWASEWASMAAFWVEVAALLGIVFCCCFFSFWESIARSCARPGRGNKNCSQILEKGPQVTRLYLRLHSQNILSQFSLEGSAWGRKVNQLQGCSMIGVTLLWYGGTRCINHSWTLKVSAWSHEQTVVWRKLEVGAFATRCRGDTGGRN